MTADKLPCQACREVAETLKGMRSHRPHRDNERHDAVLTVAAERVLNTCRHPQQGWVKCSERLPEEWTEVLAYFPHADEVGIGKWMQREDGRMWHKDGTSAHEKTLPELKFTHWMPLPPAPGEQEGR